MVNKKKRNFLVAFLLDPKFGPSFQKCTQEVVSSNKSQAVLKPETWKELLNRYDEQEIHATLDAGVISEKVDPRCPGVMKYMDTSQVSETKTVNKRFSMAQGVAKGMKGDSNENDANAMQEWQIAGLPSCPARDSRPLPRTLTLRSRAPRAPSRTRTPRATKRTTRTARRSDRPTRGSARRSIPWQTPMLRGPKPLA